MMNKGLRFGFLGSGQGGNNAVNAMAGQDKDHIYAIINIAGVDMGECKHVPDEHKLKIGDQEGAGQNIKIGRQVVIQEKERIKKWLSSVFAGCDMPYLIGSSGGGFGTIATPTISAVMAEEMQVPHSVIYITPRHNEDLIRQKNAKAGLIYLRDLAQNAQNLKGVMIVDNERLIEYAKTLDAPGGLWEKANLAIAERLQRAYKYTLRPSATAIDPMDYKKVIFRRGSYTVVEVPITVTDATTENVFALKFRELLAGDYSKDFILAGDLKRAEAVAVFIEREEPFKLEGEAIEVLKETIRDETPAILRPVGVYRPQNEEDKKTFLSFFKGKSQAQDKSTVVKMTVVFAGMPFPDYVIDDLEHRILEEDCALLEARKGIEVKRYEISEEEIGFLDEVNTVTGVKETASLLNSPILGSAFEFASSDDLEGINLVPLTKPAVGMKVVK